jgi:hypothetical protein
MNTKLAPLREANARQESNGQLQQAANACNAPAPCLGGLYHLGLHERRTKYFPRSLHVQETSWELEPSPLKDAATASESLVECEAHKYAAFTRPWSVDNKGKHADKSNNHTRDDVQAAHPLTWPQIQKLVEKENTTLVEFDVLDSQGGRDGAAHILMAWVVDSNGSILAHTSTEVHEVLGGAKDMALEALTACMDDTLRIFGRAILRKLYNLCISPVEGCLRGRKDIVLVPSGPLCFIPWAALTNRNGIYFAEGHVIRVLPHLMLLQDVYKASRLQAIRTRYCVIVMLCIYYSVMRKVHHIYIYIYIYIDTHTQTNT